MKKITFLVPCHNEEANLKPLHDELSRFAESQYTVKIGGEDGSMFEKNMDMRDYEFEFLLVNDGSKDSTLTLMEQLRREDERVSVLSLSRNFGKENAMLAGMDYAQGDAVVIIDADLQHPVSVVPEMIYWWEQGYDDVYGERLSRGKESRLRKRLSLSYYSLISKMSSIEVLPNVGDFRLLSRRAVRALISLRESERYTKGLFCWIGFDKKGVKFESGDRVAGVSNYNFRRLLGLALDGVTSYTTAPLRIATVVGLLVSLAAFAYLIFVVVKTLVWGEAVSGFPTLICIILFLGGMQLLALGIIGEYVGRIFTQAKARPPYIVEQYQGCSSEAANSIK